MKPYIFGVLGPGFLNQVPTLASNSSCLCDLCASFGSKTGPGNMDKQIAMHSAP